MQRLPSPANPPAGCQFHTRCPHVMDICRAVDPTVSLTADGALVACHLLTNPPVREGTVDGSVGS